ncbi:hypothetical protein LEP1GSC073_3084 [Leptospira noguchii str. Cascata]|nr:hypothetical protein LEP1GSC073_3084 [Leptospira noguchii str. Cascata]
MGTITNQDFTVHFENVGTITNQDFTVQLRKCGNYYNYIELILKSF